MKRLSMFSDALCAICGTPAAEGLAHRTGLLCTEHGRQAAVIDTEKALFDLLRTYPEELEATVASVRDYDGNPEHSHSWKIST